MGGLSNLDGTLFFALDPGRPGFWKIQGDPFLGPWVSNLGPFFKSRATLKNGIQGNIFIFFYFFNSYFFIFIFVLLLTFNF